MAAEAPDDRQVAGVPALPRFPLESSKLWDSDDKPNLKVLSEHLFKEGRLSMEDGLKLVGRAAALFAKEPNVLRLQDPVTVCGDVHGQFFDLLRLLEAGGDPASTQYLFLGDYVDRGCFSTECVFYLFAHKICYPDSCFFLRGNHECRHLTAFFNFKDECLYKYTDALYDAFMNCFDNLPLAATINGKFLCVHGGLSPDISTIDDIESIDRFQEVPREGPFCDLLWADPVEEKGEDASESDDDESEEITWFAYNETRQCSYIFGAEAVDAFLKRNKLTALIRAHEAQFDGYKMHMVNDATQIPRVITIFSAPNYCDVYKNKGACLKFDQDLLNIRQFVNSPHPYYLPNFMDVFTWSLPFVAEKVTDMLAHVVNVGQLDEDDADDSEEDSPSQEQAASIIQAAIAPTPKPAATGGSVLDRRGNVLKDKVIAITRLLRMYKTLREQTDLIVELKQLAPKNKLPPGLLAKGPDAIKQVISSFRDARKADRANESMPPSPGAAGSSPVPSGRQSPRQKVPIQSNILL